MTPAQKELARHALGLPNDADRSFRNRYSLAPGSDKYALWAGLVEDGDAEEHQFKDQRLHLFALTKQGAEQVLEPGETLDPEDFPS